MDSIFYSVGDKGIYDAILQGKITKDHLEEIFLSRGIVVSHKTDRKILARYFSRFPHSYEDFLRFSEILGSASQREKLTHFHLKSSIDINDLDESIVLFKEHLENSEDATCFYTRSSENGYNITVNYKVHDFNKSEFRQVTNKDATIEIVKDNDRFLIRHPNNKNVKSYVESFIEKIDEKSDGKVEIYKLSLQSISDPKVKTEFLSRLINSIDGFELYDVNDVYVYHPKESLEDDDLDDEDEEIDVFSKSESLSGTHISKASLTGRGILESDELHQLYENEFYLYRIIWQSKRANSVDSDIYEFEVTFTDPEKMSGFSYIIKGYLKYKGYGEYARRVQLNPEDSGLLNELIENAAHTSMNHIESLNDVDSEN